LEVRWAPGRSLAAFQQSHRFAVPRYDVLHLCLVREREELYERIARRTAAMLAAGLVEEMRALIAQGYDPSLKPLQSIGYRQVGEYLAGRLPREALAAEISRATRRYAKRQLTWFRHARGVTLLAPESWDAIASRIERFLGHPVSRGGDARKERHR
jgi:tRNA dimethylallyltransferase